MKLPLNFDRCILCRENEADSWEHIIPEVIGGLTQVKFLCADCNNRKLGSKLINSVKSDPTIRISINYLKNDLPRVFNSIERHQRYQGIDKNQKNIDMYMSSSGLKVQAIKKEDCLISDTNDVEKHLINYLRKDGHHEKYIKRKVGEFRDIENGKLFSLSSVMAVRKNAIEKTVQKFDGKFLDKRIPVLMAFEFLALLIDQAIYDTRLDFIRYFILSNEKSDRIDVIRSLGEGHRATHQIYPIFNESETSFFIVLFGQLIFKVTFRSFHLETYDIALLEDLIARKVLLAKSVEDARKGNFHAF